MPKDNFDKDHNRKESLGTNKLGYTENVVYYYKEIVPLIDIFNKELLVKKSTVNFLCDKLKIPDITPEDFQLTFEIIESDRQKEKDEKAFIEEKFGTSKNETMQNAVQRCCYDIEEVMNYILENFNNSLGFKYGLDEVAGKVEGLELDKDERFVVDKDGELIENYESDYELLSNIFEKFNKFISSSVILVKKFEELLDKYKDTALQYENDKNFVNNFGSAAEDHKGALFVVIYINLRLITNFIQTGAELAIGTMDFITNELAELYNQAIANEDETETDTDETDGTIADE